MLSLFFSEFHCRVFFQNDLKTPLLENVEKLKNIIFQEKLGTLYDKTKCQVPLLRMTNLSITIAKWIKTDPDITEQAACVSKCDLTTKIVGEFPELQGWQSRVSTIPRTKLLETLDEITGLVEWPVALLCNFSKDFLKLPKEFLISAMQKHQKCFPIRAEKNKNKLVAKFITISNIESKNQKQVIDGNEKVMNARLFDANFFFQNDLKTPLLENVEKLKNIIFQEKLGTLYDKTKRMTNLSITIAKWIKTDPDITEQAACVSKCDLTTKIVGEFPELQGIAGFYYSENKVIGNAIKEQYLPRFAKDTLPKTKIGAVLAIADRIDSIVGIFGINEIPTGSKDPFALRRAALGILRIIIEKNIDIDLIDLIDQSMGNYPFFKDSTKEKVLNFMFERLRNLYLDNSKISNQIFSSVFVKQITNIVDFNERIKGVLHFQKLKEASSLSSANKRVNNILKDIKENEKPDEKLFTKSYEKRLYSEILRKKEITKSFIKNRKYKEAFLELAKLNTPINNFFDNVMVMTNDGKIKNNRIKLLNQLKILFSNIADISLL